MEERNHTRILSALQPCQAETSGRRRDEELGEVSFTELRAAFAQQARGANEPELTEEQLREHWRKLPVVPAAAAPPAPAAKPKAQHRALQPQGVEQQRLVRTRAGAAFPAAAAPSPAPSGAGGGGASTAQPLPTDGTPAKKPRLAIDVVQALMDAKSLKEAGCIDSPTFADLKARLLHGE